MLLLASTFMVTIMAIRKTSAKATRNTQAAKPAAAEASTGLPAQDAQPVAAEASTAGMSATEALRSKSAQSKGSVLLEVHRLCEECITDVMKEAKGLDGTAGIGWGQEGILEGRRFTACLWDEAFIKAYRDVLYARYDSKYKHDTLSNYSGMGSNGKAYLCIARPKATRYSK